jgi:myosin heavy subunit
MALLLIFIVL